MPLHFGSSEIMSRQSGGTEICQQSYQLIRKMCLDVVLDILKVNPMWHRVEIAMPRMSDGVCVCVCACICG